MAITGLLLVPCLAARAAVPQSDNFSGTTLKSLWKSADIGQTDGGSVSVDNGQLLPVGSGNDIWGGTFQFYYVYQQNITGSFDVRVKVEKTPIPDHSDGWSGTGIMCTTPAVLTWDGTGSRVPPYVETALSNNNGVEMKWGAGGATANAAAAGGLKPPAWLRMVKAQDTFTCYYSTDNQVWNRVGSVTNPYSAFPMKDPMLLGIHVQSHDAANMGDPILSDFKAMGLATDPAGTAAPGKITDLAATNITASSLDLTWTAPTGAANYQYDIRRALIPITTDNWNSAAEVGLTLTPAAAGTKQTLSEVGIDAMQTYYYAIRTRGQNLVWSEPSNLLATGTSGGVVGDGLKGQYYAYDTTLGGSPARDEVFAAANLTATVIDPKIDFTTLPVSAPREDKWAARWTGQILAPETGDYTFYAAGDDGVRLWISDTAINVGDPGTDLLADAGWVDQGDTERAAPSPIHIEKGKKVYVLFEYYENGGGQAAHLRWSTPTLTKQVVPQAYLFSSDQVAGVGRVSGAVYDGNNKPISGVGLIITAADRKVSATTDGTGYYSALLPEGSIQITASFPAPYTDTTVSANANLKAGQATARNLTFGVVTPPFALDSPNTTYSDDFSAASLNSKWTSESIGNDDAGSASQGAGTLTVSAGGHDIWDAADDFHYVYQKIKGDFTVTLKVINVPDSQEWSKCGLQVRLNTEPNSVCWGMYATRDHGVSFQGRTVTDPNTTADNTPADVLFKQGTPMWLKLTRKGSTLLGWKSTDNNAGIGYYTQTVADLGTTEPVLLGIAVTSHLAGTLGNGVVDDFVVQTPAQGPVAVTVVPPPVTIVFGDLNGDGKFTIADAVSALRAVAGLTTLSADQQKAADVTGDGKFNITDVVTMLRRLAGIITRVPAEGTSA
jgi:regulation of enolase protein 1 (concanavalin A-like superfamily)